MSDRSKPSVFSRLGSLPARGLLGLIRLYQLTLSPVLPALFGPGCGCRFHPTCSHYAAAAVREHGALRGAGLALVRLVKCAPWHPGGVDLVPPRRRAAGFSCQRVASPAPIPVSLSAR